LGHYTFFSCPKLTNVILPSDVSAIGNYSFANCVSLESIELPETVSSIGTYGFYKCTSLKEIFINGPVDKVASNSFSGCTNLEKFILKKDINSIARRASSETNLFAVLSKNIPLYLSTDLENPLTDIVLDSATSVGNYAFYGHKYIKSITLGNSVKNVGVRAFSKCENLKTIKLTNNFGGSGYAQFYDCPNLEKVIVDDINFYAQNFGSISYGVHNSDKAGLYLSSDPDKLLTDIVIDTATEIELHAFANYTTIKSVYIGNSVKEIQNYAFENCTGLTSVTIAESVTVIGFQAFNNSSLTSATFEVTNGWYLAYSKGATSGTAISAEEMANKSTAATHLLISNDNYCLKRSTTN